MTNQRFALTCFDEGWGARSAAGLRKAGYWIDYTPDGEPARKYVGTAFLVQST